MLDELLLNDEEYILKAQELMDDWNYLEAKRILQELIEKEPGNGKAHSLIAWIYYTQLYDFEKADFHYKLALKFESKNEYILINYLRFLLIGEDYESLTAFITSWRRKTKRDSDYLRLYYALGLEGSSKLEEAEAHFDALMTSSLEPELRHSISQGVERIKQKKQLLSEEYTRGLNQFRSISWC